jgi:hypothetical protein
VVVRGGLTWELFVRVGSPVSRVACQEGVCLHDMWAAFTKSLAKDLGEFASVLTADTQRIVEGPPNEDGSPATPVAAQSASSIYTGDESSPEATIFPLDDSTIEAFQSSVGTYAIPLNTDEANEAHRLDAAVCDPSELLKRNETVRDQYAYLVTQRGAGSSASEDGPEEGSQSATHFASPKMETRVTHEEFFCRYFTRLLRLRRSASRTRKTTTTTSAVSREEPGLPSWEAPARGPLAKNQAEPTAAGDDDTSSRYERRIAELEKLVAALGSQVGHLQSENSRLQRELAAYRGTAESQRAHSVPQSSPSNIVDSSPLNNSASKTGEAVARALDDDEWATVS